MLCIQCHENPVLERDDAKVCARCFLTGMALACPDDKKGQEMAKNLLILSGDNVPDKWVIKSANMLLNKLRCSR